MTAMELASCVYPAANTVFNEAHFTFNGSPDLDLMHPAGRIMLKPSARPQPTPTIKKEQKEDYMLWTIVLRYTYDHWSNFMEYAGTHEMILDLMLNHSATGHRHNEALFKCWMTQDRSWEYAIDTKDFYTHSGITIKKAGIKVVKKEEEVIVVIKIAE